MLAANRSSFKKIKRREKMLGLFGMWAGLCIVGCIIGIIICLVVICSDFLVGYIKDRKYYNVGINWLSKDIKIFGSKWQRGVAFMIFPLLLIAAPLIGPFYGIMRFARFAFRIKASLDVVGRVAHDHNEDGDFTEVEFKQTEW
jgi:hypothetical protein